MSQTFMPAHPNCRCAPEPVTVTYRDLGLDVDEVGPPRVAGKDWFGTLAQAEQRKFFSKAGWRAYQAGAVTLDDFIGVRPSKDWGDSYVEKSLKDILGSEAGKWLTV